MVSVPWWSGFAPTLAPRSLQPLSGTARLSAILSLSAYTYATAAGGFVKVRYFAWVRERVGKAEEDIDPPDGVATVGDLVAWLTHRGEGYAYAFENPNVVRSAIDKRLVRAMRGLQARAKSHFSRR
jgi:molybdopterin synthase sulfur carrier subunit